MKNEPKQVLVWNAGLRTAGGQKVRTGKICAQLAHASMAVILDMMKESHSRHETTLSLSIKYNTPLHKWLTERFTKICVYVNSEQELLEVYQNARTANLPCALITDAGLTEFNGVPTKTCIAIGPDDPVRIDSVTGHLKLL